MRMRGLLRRARRYAGSERVWGWSRVAVRAYEQLVYAHCGREDTLRKRLELGHVRDRPRARQVIVYNSSRYPSNAERYQSRFINISKTPDDTSIFLLCGGDNKEKYCMHLFSIRCLRLEDPIKRCK